MRNRRRNNIVIGTLCAVLVLMGVGYAILSTTLNIGGTANITGDFDIHFTNIQRSSSTITDSTLLSTMDNGTGITENTSNHEGTFTAVLQKPTDYVIYDVTVANTGSIDGYLTFGFGDTNNNFDYYKDFYSVEFIRDDVDPDISTDILQQNATFTDNEVLENTTGTRTYKIKVTFKESATGFPDTTTNGDFECSLNLAFSQQAPSGDNNQQVTYVDQDESCFISVIPGEINYYDSSKAECGSSVVIPDNLRLKTTSVTSIVLNRPVCMGYAEYLKPSGMTNDQFCDYIASEISNMEPEEVFGTIYSAMITPTFGSKSDSYNLITKIGKGAFTNNTISSANLSNNSITVIDDAAFINTSLTQVNLPSNLVTIGKYAFQFNSITSLTLPQALQTIGESAFYGNNISSLVIPSNVTTIELRAFYGNKISTLTLPSSITYIGEVAFLHQFDESTEQFFLQTINIPMTKDYFDNHVQVGEDWHDTNEDPPLRIIYSDVTCDRHETNCVSN